MFNSRILSAAFILLGLAICGCHGHGGGQSASQPPGVTPAVQPSAQNPAALQNPAGGDDDAAILARKTSQYARDLAPILEQRATPGAAAPTVPSVVQWAQPTVSPDSAQTPASPNNPVAPVAPARAPAVAPATQPQLTADNSANHAVDLAAARFKDDVPEILPESADRISDAPPAPRAPTVVAPATAGSDELEKQLHQQVVDYPRDMGNQIDYQLLRFARDEPTPDLSTTAGLSTEDREILAAVLDGLNNFRNTVRADSNLLLSRKIQPILDMADRLRGRAELTIPTIALCTRVDSFGVYRPVSAPRFAAGKDNEVIVYCELANFTAVQNGDKLWETRLKQEIVLYTDTGMAVWPEKSNAQLFVDLARNRRHDFFIPRKIKLPAALTIGRYLLKVTISDVQSNRMAEATAPIEIVAE